MANNLPMILVFEVGTNPSESWRHCKEDFEDYWEALLYSETPEKTKTALFRHLCREELKEQLRAFDIKPNDGCQGVNNMVVIDSPKKLRICLDPRPLNEAIQRPHYPIPTTDALITKLQGGIVFLVLPFGLNSAPEEFRKALEEIYEEDEDINPYFDDIVLGSSTVKERCRLLRRTLLQARKANLKFNVFKMQLLQTSVNYLGHVLSYEGINLDSKKIRAIEEFATPKAVFLKLGAR
ncbi:retrovirus-related Pol polyprotein from transposon 17.6 [Trichonephila clavipes]|nr:retrovirus-related Pol polyprotein from transposon 17.6 [Trichonephila clavipes]